MNSNVFQIVDAKPPVNVKEADYLRLLGYPRDHRLEGRPRELADLSRRWFAEHGRPWIFARLAGGLAPFSGFSSRRLDAQFAAAGAHDAVLVAVSAGAECESEAARRWQADKPDEYFFLEIYGSAVVESLVALAAGQICAWADQNGMAALPHYSPGYAGWPVSDQPRLWKLIRSDNGHDVPGKLHVMDTGMLQPKKSLLTVFGLTRHREKLVPNSTLIPCVNCVLTDCRYRRAPYRNLIRQTAGIPETSPIQT